MSRPIDFYDPTDEDEPLNTPDVEEGPWRLVCQELDVFEFIHSDGRGGWAEWEPDTGELLIGDGSAQVALRQWTGDSFTENELKELAEIISRELPMAD